MPRQKGVAGVGQSGRSAAASTARYAEAWASGNYAGELNNHRGDDDDAPSTSNSTPMSIKLAMWCVHAACVQ